MNILLNEITLYVADVEQSRRFYAALGMKLNRQDIPGRQTHFEAWLRTDHTFLVQIYPASGNPPTRTRLRIEAPNIDDLAQRLDDAGFAYRIDDVLPILRATDPDGTHVYVAPPGSLR